MKKLLRVVHNRCPARNVSDRLMSGSRYRREPSDGKWANEHEKYGRLNKIKDCAETRKEVQHSTGLQVTVAAYIEP